MSPAHWLRASYSAHSAEAKSPSDAIFLPDYILGLRLPSMMIDNGIDNGIGIGIEHEDAPSIGIHTFRSSSIGIARCPQYPRRGPI